MLPQMSREPRTADRESSPTRSVHRRRDAPDIGILMEDPTLRTIMLAGDLRALVRQLADHFVERLAELRQVRRINRPVVHLCIDVGRVFRIPRGILVIVPNALKIGWLRPRT